MEFVVYNPLEDKRGSSLRSRAFDVIFTWKMQELRDMSQHKKIFVNPFHTKKVFANIKRAGKDFSGRITPLFDTMMVQASEEVGKDSDHLTDSNQIPIIDQPSTSSQPKQKQKSKRRIEERSKVPQYETELRKRLERKKKLRTTCLRRLKKVGMSRRVESFEDRESLGDHEDASKQGRSIEDIDADGEVTLVNETQERQDDDLMFDTGVLDDDEVFVDVTAVEKEEQSIKDSQSVLRLHGVEEEEHVSVFKPTVSVTQPSVKDKGKAMMEADRLLAKRLQTREREELTDEEKGKLFME
ncbi:hypothetical protein Tco_0586642 [Tanacetum coccineum]